MFKINFRVMKKNSLPDNATLLQTTSSKKRFASGFHWWDGTERKIFIGFLDSSLTWAANSETAKVRMITKTQEKTTLTMSVLWFHFFCYFQMKIVYQKSVKTRNIACDNTLEVVWNHKRVQINAFKTARSNGKFMNNWNEIWP